MAHVEASDDTEVAILGRLFLNGRKPVTLPQARFLLDLDFSDEDKARMNELAGRNQQGLLSEAERETLLGYAKAGCLLGMLHSRARRVLKKSNERRRS